MYLRLRQLIRDNLLLSSGKIEHDGTTPTTDEVLSATTERPIDLRWLELLRPSLPNHVSNVFALDLQTKSLKDLQPRINEQINDLLFQVHNKSEDTSVDLSFTRFSNNQFNNSSGNSYGGYKRSSNEYRNSSSKYNGNRENF